MTETTALGAAYAAGLAVGFWSSPDELHGNWAEHKTWQSRMDDAQRQKRIAGWRKAVQRRFDWVGLMD